MSSILKREQELFIETYRLRGASFEATMRNKGKDKNFIQSKKIQEKQNEVYKKQQFFKKYLKEMERRKND